MAREGQTRIDLWLPDALRQRAEKAAAIDRRSLSSFFRCAAEAACTKAEEQAHSKPLQERPLQ